MGQPIRVAFMGEFSTGKSTLINCFLAGIFGIPVSEIPQEILRRTGLQPVDTRITVLQHSSATRVLDAKWIDVVPVRHDLFKILNLVDTPGRDSEPFDDQNVIDFLSRVDVIVYLFNTVHQFGLRDRQFFTEKLKNFPHTPICFVLSHAETHLFDDSGILKTNTLEPLVESLNNRMETIPGRTERVFFEVGKNLFPVGSQKGFGFADLYRHVLSQYASEEAWDRKLGALVGDLIHLASRVKTVLLELKDAIRACNEFVDDYVGRFLHQEDQELHGRLRGILGEAQARLREALDRRLQELQLMDKSAMFPQLPRLTEACPSVDGVLPGTLPGLELKDMAREQRLLQEQVSQAQDSEEFLVSKAEFLAKFFQFRGSWLRNETDRLRRDGEIPFDPFCAAQSVPLDQMRSKRGDQVRKALEERIGSFLRVFSADSDESILSSFRNSIDLASERYRRYFGEIRLAATQWQDRDIKGLYESTNSVLPEEIGRILRRLLPDLDAAMKTRLIVPLRIFGEQASEEIVGDQDLGEFQDSLFAQSIRILSDRRETSANKVVAQLRTLIDNVDAKELLIQAEREEWIRQLEPFLKRAEKLAQALAEIRSNDRVFASLLAQFVERYEEFSTELDKRLRDEDDVLFRAARDYERQRDEDLRDSRKGEHEAVVQIERARQAELAVLEDGIHREISQVRALSEHEINQVEQRQAEMKNDLRKHWRRCVKRDLLIALGSAIGVGIAISFLIANASESAIFAMVGGMTTGAAGGAMYCLGRVLFHRLRLTAQEQLEDMRAEIEVKRIQKQEESDIAAIDKRRTSDVGRIESKAEGDKRQAMGENRSYREQRKLQVKHEIIKRQQDSLNLMTGHFLKFQGTTLEAIVAANGEARTLIVGQFTKTIFEIDQMYSDLKPVLTQLRQGIDTVLVENRNAVKGELDRLTANLFGQFQADVRVVPTDWHRNIEDGPLAGWIRGTVERAKKNIHDLYEDNATTIEGLGKLARTCEALSENARKLRPT